MAGSLELGKLVTAAFLYRYWDKINYFQKVYLSIAVVTLILITSAGIFGYLSNAYQGATVSFEKQSNKLLANEDRLEQLLEDKSFLKEELEIQVSDLPDNYITAKRKLREEYNPRIQSVNDEILRVKGEIGDLKVELVETGVDVGPAIYLARVFDTDVDSVVKFFIFILIFVFDPLAVMLVVAFNQALILREEELEDPASRGEIQSSDDDYLITKSKKNWWEVYGEKKDNILKREQVIPKDEVVEEEETEEIEKIAKGGIKV